MIPLVSKDLVHVEWSEDGSYIVHTPSEIFCSTIGGRKPFIIVNNSYFKFFSCKKYK